MFCLFYVIISLILHNYNVNSLGNTELKFAKRCLSLYCFRLSAKLTHFTKYTEEGIYKGEFRMLHMVALILIL